MSVFVDLIDHAPRILSHEARIDMAYKTMDLMGYHRYECDRDGNELRLKWSGHDTPLIIALFELINYRPESGYGKEWVNFASEAWGDDPEHVHYQVDDELAYPLFVAGQPLTKEWIGKGTGRKMSGRAVSLRCAPWISKYALGSLFENAEDWTELESFVSQTKDLIESMRTKHAPSRDEVIRGLNQYCPVAQELRPKVVKAYIEKAYEKLNVVETSSSYDAAKSKKLRTLAKKLLSFQPPSGYSEKYAGQALNSVWTSADDIKTQLLILNDPKTYLAQKHKTHNFVNHYDGPKQALDPDHVYLNFAWKDIPRGYKSHVNQVRSSLGMQAN